MNDNAIVSVVLFIVFVLLVLIIRFLPPGKPQKK